MKFQRSSGAPINEADAPVIGRALLKIAEDHKVGDFRALTAKVVLDKILADKNHPMRRFYAWDLKKAAYAHWLERTEVLIRSVRIVEANVRPLKPREMFVSVKDVRTEDGRGKSVSHGRMRVLAPDASDHDDTFVRCLDAKIARIEQALEGAENWLERGTAPARYENLLRDLRAAFDSAKKKAA